MGRISRKKLVLGGIIGVLAIGAVSGNEPDPEPRAAQATPTTTVTSAPTVELTPDTASSDQYAEFLLHTFYALPEAQELLGKISASSSAQDVDAVVGHLSRFERWLRDEIEWLEGNPPHACYAEIHAGALESHELSRRGVEGMRDFFLGETDESGFHRGTALFEQGYERLDEVSALIEGDSTC